MKKVSVFILIVLFLGVLNAETANVLEIKQGRSEIMAARQAQHAAFRESLKGKSKEERAVLVAEYRAKIQKENEALKAKALERKTKASKAKRNNPKP